jgi:hypothetical protein
MRVEAGWRQVFRVCGGGELVSQGIVKTIDIHWGSESCFC